MAGACNKAKENLKASLKEQCSREADDLVQELTSKHQNVLSETAEDMTEQQK